MRKLERARIFKGRSSAPWPSYSLLSDAYNHKMSHDNKLSFSLWNKTFPPKSFPSLEKGSYNLRKHEYRTVNKTYKHDILIYDKCTFQQTKDFVKTWVFLNAVFSSKSQTSQHFFKYNNILSGYDLLRGIIIPRKFNYHPLDFSQFNKIWPCCKRTEYVPEYV